MKDEQAKSSRQETNPERGKDKKGQKRGSADIINAIISSPVDAVRSRMHHADWSHTGTNISYQGTTAPGGAGSVGTGEASGHDAVGARISTMDEPDYVLHKRSKRWEKSRAQVVHRRSRKGGKAQEGNDTLGIP